MELSLRIAAVYDRDYRSDKETTSLKKRLDKEITFAHFHQRKEIENYLLAPHVLERAARKAIEERVRRGGDTVDAQLDIVGLLESITTERKPECSGQYIGKYTEYSRAGGKDPATLATEALTMFETQWTPWNLGWRLCPEKMS